MIENDLVKIEEQRRAVAGELEVYLEPFAKKDKGEIRFLEQRRSQLQGKIAVSASEFLKANGFRADGSRRKR